MARMSALAVAVLVVGACTPVTHQHVRVHTEDAAQRFAQGAYADARDCYQAALALKPGDPDLIFNLAQCHARLGRADQAETLCKECLRHDPDHGEARHALLVLMVEGGRLDEGRTMVDTWRRERPQIAGPYVEEAWLRGRDGDLDAARAYYQRALELEPRHPRALTELAAVYEKLGHPERALVLYERSLEARPNQPAVTKLVSDLRRRGVGRPQPD